MQQRIKSGFISESRITLAPISQKMCHITILSVLYPPKDLEKMLRIVFGTFFGDLSQRENLSEIKPPLFRVLYIFWLVHWFDQKMFKTGK